MLCKASASAGSVRCLRGIVWSMGWRDWSQTWTFFQGEWHEGNLPIWGVRTHAIWLGSSVFDGARVFEGVAPDLDLHCARVNASAKTMHLKPGCDGRAAGSSSAMTASSASRRAPRSTCGRWSGPSAPGPRRCRPIRTRRAGAFALRHADAQARRLLDHAVAVPPADHRDRAGRRQGRLPLSEQRAGDARGEVARLRQLPGLRRAGQHRRACQLQRVHGARTAWCSRRCRTARSSPASPGSGCSSSCAPTASRWSRRRCAIKDFETADEIFATGNASKVMPITRIGDRALQPGPMFRKARELYWAFAHGG